jgi:hypothetical protein
VGTQRRNEAQCIGSIAKPFKIPQPYFEIWLTLLKKPRFATEVSSCDPFESIVTHCVQWLRKYTGSDLNKLVTAELN